jgi:hypothetical protein
MLTLLEYIETTEFPIDMDVFREVGTIDNDQVLILLSERLVRFIGFEGTLSRQKSKIVSLLKARFRQDRDFHIYSRTEYKERYLALVERQAAAVQSIEPQSLATSSRVSASSRVAASSRLPVVPQVPAVHVALPSPRKRTPRGYKYVLLAPKVFKLMCMIANTPNTARIRTYFAQMEELSVRYLRYQCDYWRQSFTEAHSKLEKMEHNVDHTFKLKLAQFKQHHIEYNREGFIYFVHQADSSFVKIGYAYDVPRRLADLRVSNPKRLILILYYFARFPRMEELFVHRLYRSYSRGGEWYELPAAVIQAIASTKKEKIRNWQDLPQPTTFFSFKWIGNTLNTLFF